MQRYRFVTCALVCLALMATMAFAADMSLGTWKLNLAKSKFDPANVAPKSQTVKNEAAPDGVKQVGDIVDSAGKAVKTEYTAKYDGKDYAVKGDDGRWRFRKRIVRLWDGAVLSLFPGKGEWVARKRPESLIIRR